MSRRGRGGRNRHNNKNQRGERGGGPGQRQDHRQTGQHAPSQTTPDSNAGQRHQQAGKVAFQSAIQPKRTLSRPPKEPTVAAKSSDKAYRVAFYDTIAQAKGDMNALRELAAQCDQLNIVVRAEAPMDDAELTSVGKLFCGAAWALIHERRKSDGWYEQPHE